MKDGIGVAPLCEHEISLRGVIMLIENQKVETTWNPFTMKYYQSKGYVYTGKGTKLIVDIKDLSTGSNAIVKVICDFCGKEYTKSYKKYLVQHKNGDCCQECLGKKSSKVLSEIYTKEEWKNLIGDSLELKYGVRNPAQIDGIFDKIKQTNLSRYGVENVLLLDENKEKAYKNMWLEDAKHKRIQTNLERYGTEWGLSNPDIRRKIAKSYMEHGTVPTSKQQYNLYQLLSAYYSNCQLNYAYDKYLLDCVISINNMMIDIEYDGFYWHQFKHDKDEIRDNFLINQGWKILRIVSSRSIPAIEEIQEKLLTLTSTDVCIEKILMI